MDKTKLKIKSFDPTKYQAYLNAYAKEEAQKEPKRYKPFSSWVNYIISELKLIPGFENSELNIHSLGSKHLGNCFPSLRYPDAAGTLFKELPKFWAFILLVIEFKKEKEKAAAKRKIKESLTEDFVQKKQKTQSSGTQPVESKTKRKSNSQSRPWLYRYKEYEGRGGIGG